MAFNRGDIVEVYFDLPYTRETKLHPAIIISNEDVYNTDEMYICVMMTSSKQTDIFTFEITDDMLTFKSKKKFNQARCHLVSYIMEKHITNGQPLNTLKPNIVDRLVDRINEVSLSDY